MSTSSSAPAPDARTASSWPAMHRVTHDEIRRAAERWQRVLAALGPK